MKFRTCLAILLLSALSLPARAEQYVVGGEGLEAVDLGLSVQWASYNVGAERKEGFGHYFAWGETDYKDEYSSDEYKWNDMNGDFSKYNDSDNCTRIEALDDAARERFGDSWRIPTQEEWEELMYDCNWDWVSMNGVQGYKVTGKNGKWIFLPAAGYRINYSPAQGLNGAYWSSDIGDRGYACCLSFDSVRYEMKEGPRSMGLPIRPVKEYDVFNISLTTGEPSEIGITDATLSGTLTFSSNGNIGKKASFFFGKESGKGALIANGEAITGIPGENGAFSAQVTGLEPDRTYYYMAYVKLYDKTYYGEVKTLKTRDINFTVQTCGVTDAACFSSTLHGSFTCGESYPFPKKAWIVYGNSANAETLLSSGIKVPCAMGEDGAFEAPVKDLLHNTTYYYLAGGEIMGQERRGEVKSFKTADIAATLACKGATEIRELDATVTGSLTQVIPETLPQNVWIMVSDAHATISSLQSSGKRVNARMFQDGSFQCTLTGLDYGTQYYYAVFASVGPKVFEGELLTFTTWNPAEMVDLGLSVKWRGWNLGASHPAEPGDYFSWGESASKYAFTGENYQLSKVKSDGGRYLTKYNFDAKYGRNDGKSTLDSGDDAAHAILKSKWRIPTAEEWKELREKCTWTQITLRGVKGYKVTGKNGNWIFLPFTGFRKGETVLSPSTGYYWSASLSADHPGNARYLQTDPSGIFYKSTYRYYGLTVRPVL